jgi:cobalt/nickel transport system permease protein
MHIPDGFLSPGVAASTGVVAGGSIALALRAERRDPALMPAGILGSVAAFLFAAQMVNVPVAPGTSGHLVGAMLAVVLLGPWRAMLAMATVLGVQALLFQDGGITAFGANFIDMGLAGCVVGYTIAHVATLRIRGPRGVAAGAVLGAFAATVGGAALVAVWLSLSGLYPLRGILPVMLVTHVAIGLLESALTGAILVTLLKWRPDLAPGIGVGPAERRPMVLAIGVLGVALLVAAFVAPFASSLPDGLDKTAHMLGFAERSGVLWHAPMPDYGLPWARLALVAPAVAVAGIIGTLAAAVMGWAISRSLAIRDDASHR